MDRFLAIFLGWPAAFLILKYRRQVKDFLGDVSWAERVFGMGGTNTLVVLIGIILFIGCGMYAIGTLQGVMHAIFGRFFLTD